MRPRVDDLQTMRFGRDNIELSAIRLEQHVRRLASQRQIRHQHAAPQVHHRKPPLGPAHRERNATVRQNRDVIRLRHHGNAAAQRQRRRVVDAQRAVPVVHHHYGFSVRRHARQHRLAPRPRAPHDAVRRKINRQQRVVAGGRRIHTSAIGRKIQRIGKWPHRNARGDLVRARIEDPNVPASAADAQDLRARRMLPHAREARPHGNARHRLQLHQVHDGNAPVGRADVGAQMQIGPQERWPVLAQQHDQPANAQHYRQEVHTKISRARHGGDAILPCIEETSKAARSIATRLAP